MFLVPVVVVNVGAIEAVDHRGGTIKPLYGLEDFEGDAGAVVRVGVAPRIDGEDDVRERRGEREGVDPDFPVVVPGADVEDRGDGLPCGTAVCGSEFEGDVADAGRSTLRCTARRYPRSHHGDTHCPRARCGCGSASCPPPPRPTVQLLPLLWLPLLGVWLVLLALR